jgi:GTPase
VRPVENEAGDSAALDKLELRYSPPSDPRGETYDFLELCAAAGLSYTTTLEYNLKRPSPALYVGSGQFEDIAAQARELEVELVALNAALSPIQQRNWEEKLGLPVLSRNDIIFAIFEENAHTAEGQLQVELARLKYELPRIVRSYERLDPLGGGIGTLGPGEQLTERIKRRHRRRIYDIEKKLEKLCEQRALRRQRRLRSGEYMASIVGYTNAGKSTLLNTLTGSGVLVEDKYFATLDPTVRVLRLPSGRKLLLIDTVGFIDDLPKELLTSFRATLEEMHGSRLLIHLADASHPRMTNQVNAVRAIIAQIGLGEVPELLVLNKCDRLDDGARVALLEQSEATAVGEPVQVSALNGEGLYELLERLEAVIAESGKPVPGQVW